MLGKLYLVKEPASADDDYKSSATMYNYFTNGIKSGNRNGNGFTTSTAAVKDTTAPPKIINTESKTGNE